MKLQMTMIVLCMVLLSVVATPIATPNPTKTRKPPKTSAPTSQPTRQPTNSPTLSPTKSPTASPSVSPTNSPSRSPTATPTISPTLSPTTSPTEYEVPQERVYMVASAAGALSVGGAAVMLYRTRRASKRRRIAKSKNTSLASGESQSFMSLVIGPGSERELSTTLAPPPPPPTTSHAAAAPWKPSFRASRQDSWGNSMRPDKQARKSQVVEIRQAGPHRTHSKRFQVGRSRGGNSIRSTKGKQRGIPSPRESRHRPPVDNSRRSWRPSRRSQVSIRFPRSSASTTPRSTVSSAASTASKLRFGIGKASDSMYQQRLETKAAIIQIKSGRSSQQSRTHS